MAASNETQMVLRRDESIIVSNGQQPPMTSALNGVYSSDYRSILH